MKSILISIKPKWVAKILNGEKTIEIRKSAPKCKLPIDVYIYCTKDSDILYTNVLTGNFYLNLYKDKIAPGVVGRNGKVVGKFTLKKIEPVYLRMWSSVTCSWNNYYTESLSNIGPDSALDYQEMLHYLGIGMEGERVGFAWFISDLVIFEEPMELVEFKQWEIPYPKRIKWPSWESNYYTALGAYVKQHPTMLVSEIKRTFDDSISVKRAPQSWCYVEELI